MEAVTTTPDPRAVEILAERLCAHWFGVGTHHGWPTLDEFGPHADRYDQIRAEFRATAQGHLVAIADSGIRPARTISDGTARHALIVAAETVDAVGELATHCDTLSRRLTAAITEGVHAAAVGYAVGHLDPADWPCRVTLDVEATPDRLHAEAARLTDETGDDWGVYAIVRVSTPGADGDDRG